MSFFFLNKNEDRPLRCLINGGRVKLNETGWVGILKNPLISVTNEKRDKCLISMLNLKVSKQTKSENKVTLVRTR